MRRHRWIALVALLGVLLHSAVLVRHNGLMVSANLQAADLAAALAVICHGTGAELAAVGDVPALPAPSNTQSDCPICSGMLATAVALPALAALEPPVFVASERIAHIAQLIGPQLRSIWPPTRAPPLTV